MKALEVYDCIFAALGEDKLSDSFYHIAPGLLPFFEYCATSTKPYYIELLEKHVIPICVRMSQSLPALLNSLLHGLDENCIENHDKIYKLIYEIESQFDRTIFLEACVAIFASSLDQRVGIIMYFSNRISQSTSTLFDLTQDKDQDIFLSFLSIGIDDKNLVVIRGCLDIVIATINLSDDKCCGVNYKVRVLQSTLRVLTRKDMSLSRRFLQ
jgi:hypothetical protein